MALIQHKVGATFSYDILETSGELSEAEIAALVVSCELRKNSGSRELIQNLQISLLSNGWRLFASSAETEDWPEGSEILFDLRIRDQAGKIEYSDTVIIDVVRSITRA